MKKTPRATAVRATARATARAGLLAAVLFSTAAALPAQEAAEVPVETFELANGMRFLVVEKPELTNVYAGWVAHVGSSNERPGITGISHFFEHMMFKGTRTIGTRDIEADLAVLEEQERVQEAIRAEHRKQRERYRLGEIENPFSDDARTPELVELEKRFQELVAKQRELMVKDELDRIYKEAGGSGLNAFTSQDLTAYIVTLPANKLELWFWMESNRLLEPVFREFYSERDVVYEERRLRTESTPTGEFDEMFNAMFWQSHPYSWPVVGWPSDLESYTLAQAKAYYDTYYAPNNLTGILVGNLGAAEARAFAERYFGRLERGAAEPPDVVTLEMEQRAEKRMVAECDCPPQVGIQYHTVPFRHRDSYALDVLAGLLNGQTGRLYKAMTLGAQIASDARAGQDSNKWAGSFSFVAEAKGEATPARLEEAWYEELRRIREEPIPHPELQKVKNQIAADAVRRLSNPFFLLLQLMIYDGLGDWRYLNYWAEKTLAVTEEDVKRVAQQYFAPENRAVAHYLRKEGAAPPQEIPPELADLPEPARRQVMAQLEQIRAENDAAKLEVDLNRLRESKSQAPPQFQKALELMEKTMRERIEALGAEGGES